MELNLNKMLDKIKQNDFVEKFIKELSKELEKNNIKNGEMKMDFNLTEDEELEFEREEFNFLQDYFKQELSDISKGEIYIVTNKYENDEYHRYKVTQYKNNLECKYIAFAKDLPDNVKLRDVVRKIDEKYIYAYKATKYIKESLDKIKQNIIKREHKF